MTQLVWDEVGTRRFETGVDRGVLYLLDGSAVPWNGLTSVTENRAREVKSYYADGVKYLDRSLPDAFSGKLSAITYPDELEELLGNPEFAPGLILHEQPAKMFHLSYRTRIGNDVDGVEHGYKIHVIYNVIASPADATFNSLSNEVTPTPFEWDLRGTPSAMFGVRPTSHISIDSRTSHSILLTLIDMFLYGTDTLDPALPSMVDLLTLFEEFYQAFDQ